MSDPRDDIPMFSRTGYTNSSGKLTQRLDIPCTEELSDAIVAMAALAGVPKAEYARRLLERAMFGELPMARRLSSQARFDPSEDDRRYG